MKTELLLNSKAAIIEKLNHLKNDSFQTIVKNIKPGSFERTKNSPDYQSRVIYTKELRNFVYSPATLNIIFTDPIIKSLFFKTFGYNGQADFTLYPNCWLRDLPLLNFGKDVYLGDGILLGTNQIDSDQNSIRVGKIAIGDRTIFDQKCAIGLNTSIGKDCIIGYHVSIGLKCTIGDDTKVEALTVIGHGTTIGKNVHIQIHSKIGNFVLIEDGLTVPEFSCIPTFSRVTKDGVISRRTERLQNEPVTLY